MKGRAKRGLLVFAFLILVLPYLNHRFGIINSGILQGYYTNAPDDTFTVKGYFDGTWQTAVNNYYNDHIGFRPDLLRLNSQIDYTFFQKLDYGGTTLGNDGYLFYNNYIDAYFGRDFAGDSILRTRMIKLKCIQDTLARMGKSLVIVYAPCKAWYYPEYIPERSRHPTGTRNNYKTNVRFGDSLGINQIDFNAWFLAMKDTTRNRLYARQGIHWTNYGAALAGDSIARYIERLRSIRMPHPVCTKVTRTTEAMSPDNDMSGILNLIFHIRSDTLTYPDYSWNIDSGSVRPRCIYIGDSYVVNLLLMGMIQHASSDWQFWFYFSKLVNKANYEGNWEAWKVADIDCKEEIKKSDCVILLYTPMNAAVFGNGFAEEIYKAYFPG